MKSFFIYYLDAVKILYIRTITTYSDCQRRITCNTPSPSFERFIALMHRVAYVSVGIL